uniref:Uncharacterized protein n=1 Tax=Setaria italica TaxID=4555 RepID=K3XPI8_SETIT
MRAKKMKDQLEQQFPIKLPYNKVWEGRQCALEGLHGTWEDSFKTLWSFKVELEATYLGSIVEIDCKKKKDGKDYVHEYYSLEHFKTTYQFEVNPMVDMTQWPVVDPGFEMLPPKLERAASRCKVKRINSRSEPG